MHELGIVFHIIKEVKKVAQENNCSKVSKVVMNIGEVSTVVPYYLEDCWNWAVAKEEGLLAERQPDSGTIKQLEEFMKNA